MLIDIHPHIISADNDRFPPAPIGGKASSWSAKRTMEYEEMLAAMDELGVARSVLVQAATYYGYDNSYVASAIAAHPGRLGGVFTIDALAPDAPAQLEYWKSKRFSGVRLFVSGTSMPTEASWFSEPAAFPFWEKAIALELPVCLQIGANAIPQVRDVLVRFPTVRIVLDHLGRPPVEDGAPFSAAADFFSLAAFPNLYLKFTPVNAIALGKVGKEIGDAFLERMFTAFGAHRIAWGSNFPSTTATLREAYTICNEALASRSEEERTWVFGRTALAIYPDVAKTAASA